MAFICYRENQSHSSRQHALNYYIGTVTKLIYIRLIVINFILYAILFNNPQSFK